MLRKLFASIRCRLGFHSWKSYGGNVNSDHGLITLIWWECSRCAECKLKCIYCEIAANHLGAERERFPLFAEPTLKQKELL